MKQSTNTMNTLEQQLHAAYLDYRNNFLTVEGFASFYGYEKNTAEMIISSGRQITEFHEMINGMKTK